MRRSRTLTATAIALAGLAAAAAGPLAGAAPAGATAVPPVLFPCPIAIPTTPATDYVKLPGNGVDLGNDGLNSSNDPNCSATVRWDTAGGTITPTITGDIILKNSLGVNARVSATFSDVWGNVLGSRVPGTKVGVVNAEQSFPITINSFSSPLAYEVSIATQVLSAGSWVDVNRDSVFLSSSNQAPDPVVIAAVSTDFGSGGLAGGAPVAPGTLTWNVAAGTTSVTLSGELTLTNSLGVSARMRVRTFDVRGVQLTSTHGITRTPPSNAQTPFAVSLTTPSNPLMFRADTSIEVLVAGSWVPSGPTVTSYI